MPGGLDHGALGKDAVDRFSDVIERADSLAVGPGMGTGDDQRALVEKVVAEVALPLVLDADALNVLAWDVGPLVDRKDAAVITPHPAELARLLGSDTEDVTADRIGAAVEASKRFPGSAVVLKGYRTIVTYGRGAAALVIPTGGPELATAGTGDVLTGALATVLAGGSHGAAGTVAAFVHGLAGTIAAESKGTSGVLATRCGRGASRGAGTDAFVGGVLRALRVAAGASHVTLFASSAVGSASSKAAKASTTSGSN